MKLAGQSGPDAQGDYKKCTFQLLGAAHSTSIKGVLKCFSSLTPPQPPPHRDSVGLFQDHYTTNKRTGST